MIKIFNKIKISVMAAVVALMGLTACNDYLDVVPDGGDPTLPDAFALRSVAYRYLGTCYSYMPKDGTGSDPAMLGSDELVDLYPRTTGKYFSTSMTMIARGYQNKSTVYGNDWHSLFTGIRDCDNLIDNVDLVPDMNQEEKNQWKAEARFLKAYYHFCLIRKWGAIPVVKHSLPMDASVEDVRVYRDPIDTCFNFVLSELDKAIPDLAESFSNTEYGRITKAIGYAFKARVACYAASPLFNGNDDQKNLVDKRGVQLFPTKTEEQKLERWQYAVDACKAAIEECQKINLKLYEGEDILYRMNDTLKTDLILRGAMCERWNSELIWGNTQSWTSERINWQVMGCVNLQYEENPQFTGALTGYRCFGVPLKVAEEFYSKHGVPIAVDKDRQAGWNEMEIKRGDEQNQFYLERGYETVKLNFDREPRFYASILPNGYYWPDKNSPKRFTCYSGKEATAPWAASGSAVRVGYAWIRFYPINHPLKAQTDYTGLKHVYPAFRMAEVYLNYAEACNEKPNRDEAEALKYLNLVRERVGLKNIEEAYPEVIGNKELLRTLIKKEKMVEFAMENMRHYDACRWLDAEKEYPCDNWTLKCTSENYEDSYQRVFDEFIGGPAKFEKKDYFFPVNSGDLAKMPNWTQNYGF